MMYGALFFMAGAYTLARGGHVRADIFYRLWAPRTQAKLDLLLYFVFFFPGVVALVWAGTEHAEESWRYREVSIFSPTGVPLYPLKTLLPIGAALLFLQGVAEVFRCVRCIRDGQWPRRLRRGGAGEPDRRAVPDGRRRRRGGGAMTDAHVAIVMLCLFITAIFLGFPIAFTLWPWPSSSAGTPWASGS